MRKQNEKTLAFYSFLQTSLSPSFQELKKEFSNENYIHNVESIHRLRVALRRLQTVFELISVCSPAKAITKINDSLHSSIKLFTVIRDLDVQRDSLIQALIFNKNTKIIPGLKRLLLRINQNREVKSNKISNSHRLTKLVKRIEKFVHPNEVTAITKYDLKIINPQFHEFVKVEITKSVNDFLSYENCLSFPEDKRSLHSMRISAKHLRYMLELFNSVWGSNWEKELIVMKGIQADLGKIHDCDVWIKYLQDFKKEEIARVENFFGNQKPFARIEPGIIWFEDITIAKRSKLFKNYRRKWFTQIRQGVEQILFSDQKIL